MIWVKSTMDYADVVKVQLIKDRMTIINSMSIKQIQSSMISLMALISYGF